MQFSSSKSYAISKSIVRFRPCQTRPLYTHIQPLSTTSKALGDSKRQTGYLRKGMRIATLQFAPQLGDVEGNIKRADRLLKLTGENDRPEEPGIEALKPDILVLPEMAFSGESMVASTQQVMIKNSLVCTHA